MADRMPQFPICYVPVESNLLIMVKKQNNQRKTPVMHISGIH